MKALSCLGPQQMRSPAPRAAGGPEQNLHLELSRSCRMKLVRFVSNSPALERVERFNLKLTFSSPIPMGRAHLMSGTERRHRLSCRRRRWLISSLRAALECAILAVRKGSIISQRSPLAAGNSSSIACIAPTSTVSARASSSGFFHPGCARLEPIRSRAGFGSTRRLRAQLTIPRYTSLPSVTRTISAMMWRLAAVSMAL